MNMSKSELLAIIPGNLAILLVALCLGISGCQHELKDRIPASWKQFVKKAESGEAPYFKQLAVELKENEMSYEWNSSSYDLDQNRGEIRVLVARPNKDPLKVGYLFELDDGEWKRTAALDYTDHKAWP